MNILLSNDDGIDAPGIRALVEELKDEYTLFVSAPHNQCSAQSHHVNYFFADIYAEKREIEGVKEAWAVEGTPADAVYLGLNGLISEPIDLVISGINKGWNVSTDTIYSGTVQAAIEALINHVPAMAASQASFESDDFVDSAKVIHGLIPVYLAQENHHKYVFSVNIPYIPKEEMKGYKVKTFEKPWSYSNVSTIEKITEKRICFHTTPDLTRENGGLTNEEVDASNVRQGYIVITPIGVDSVHHYHMDKLKPLEDMSVK